MVWWLGRRPSGLECRVQVVSLHEADLAREQECNLTMAYAVQMLKCGQIRDKLVYSAQPPVVI